MSSRNRAANRPANETDHPHILFFSEDGPVADIYRHHLPATWEFTTLRDRDDESEKLGKLPLADVLIHRDVAIEPSHLEVAARLRLVHRQGVGTDGLAADHLRRLGVVACICPHGTAASVADHALLLLQAAGRHLIQLHTEVTRQGRWPKSEYRHLSLGLQGATVGIVGFGRIGQAVAKRLLAHESRVLVHDPHLEAVPDTFRPHEIELASGLDDVFRRADAVTLHCPLTDKTRGMVDHRVLALMKPSAVLVNTARGGIVVERDLVNSLRDGSLSAAGLDCLATEPPRQHHPLFDLPNVVVTPHTAAGTAQTAHTKARSVIANIDRFLRGNEPEFRVV